MARRGENIYKRRDGRWEGRYIKSYEFSGKVHYGYVYGQTYGETKSKLREAQAATTQSSVKSCLTSYSNILDLWLSAIQFTVKESTYARYVHLVERHIKPMLGRFPVAKISTIMIEQYIHHLLKEGRLDSKGGLSPKSASDILTIIKSSMEYASDNNVSVLCNLRKLAVKKEHREMRILSMDEQNTLTDYLMTDLDLIKLGILLSMFTGIRIGEVCALRWENLRLDQGILQIRETLQRVQDVTQSGITKTKIIVTEPKSQCSIRDIPLPKFLIEIARQFEGYPEAFILTGCAERYVEPRTLQNKFKRYINDCCIPPTNYHALRHTFATRCVELGFETKSLSEILGHANVNITLNRYVHSSIELKRENMAKIDLPISISRQES